jgi:AcrR family transcriptional regulator
MSTRANAPFKKTVPNGLASARDGLGPQLMGEIQRARILTAMVQISGEHDRENVTVAQVVKRAGVSRRTFYEIFIDRDDCFLRAFDDGIDRASRYVLDAYDPDARWAERIRTALTGLLSFLDVERGTGHLLIVGSLGAGSEALERRQSVLTQMITLVDEGRKESKVGTEPPLVTAEGIVGGVLSVLHSRLLEDTPRRLGELTGPLMSMIVLPYLGPTAARKELGSPVPLVAAKVGTIEGDPLRGIGMRLTYRTICVLMAVAARPGGSNRQVADSSEIADQGQISKLLARLKRLGLIENTGAASVRGAPNSWVLTNRGWEVQGAIARQSATT